MKQLSYCEQSVRVNLTIIETVATRLNKYNAQTVYIHTIACGIESSRTFTNEHARVYKTNITIHYV